MSGKSMRLSFKGDKPKKKRKTTSDRTKNGSDDDLPTSTTTDSTSQWSTATDISHFMGPLLLLSTATPHPSCLVVNEKTNALALQSLGPDPDVVLSTVEPVHVGQVFLAARLPTGEARVSIKSAFDMYLSCDKFGEVTCEKEAVGPYEEWEVVKREDGWILQSVVKNAYLSAEPDGKDDASVDEDARKRIAMGKTGWGVGAGRVCGSVRADAETVGFREVFQIRCHTQNKINAHKKKKKEMEDLDSAAVDADQLKKFQSYGRTQMNEKEAAILKRAQKQGNLNEALLERREKPSSTLPTPKPRTTTTTTTTAKLPALARTLSKAPTTTSTTVRKQTSLANTPPASRASTPPVSRSRSAAPASSLLNSSAAAKRKEAAEANLEKEYLVAALKEQVVELERKLERRESGEADQSVDSEGSVVVATPEPSPLIKVAELQSKLKMQDLVIQKLESKVTAFVSKDSAVAFLMQDKENSEARLDMIIKDKDMTIEMMRRQIEMQVTGLFSEVNKSRELLVSQAETHAEDLKRLNAMVTSQAQELGQLREMLKERGVTLDE
ncbi:hypothetical protein HDU98_007725 [Podochytrium sp. JEL0797]|nr:hypothetical protein HDU98_007725 [Podochytrium sp. JEL0797]